jgi:predicted RNase H-like nuclease (RuvC/YqgF family)
MPIASQWKWTLMSDDQFINATSRQSTTATALKASIEVLQSEIAKLEGLISSHQTEFRATIVERDRAEHLMAELLRMTADLMSAQEAVTRLVGELSALRSMRSLRPWWWRMLAGWLRQSHAGTAVPVHVTVPKRRSVALANMR